MHFNIMRQTHIIGAIRSAIEMDLFMKVPADGNPITAAELASKSGAERLLIGNSHEKVQQLWVSKMSKGLSPHPTSFNLQ